MPPLAVRWAQAVAMNMKKNDKYIFNTRVFVYNIVRAWVISAGAQQGMVIGQICSIHDIFTVLQIIHVDPKDILPYYIAENALELEDAYMSYGEIDTDLWLEELGRVFCTYGKEDGQWLGAYYPTTDEFVSQITQKLC